MQHTKLKRLVRALKVPQYAAVGILESLWHLTAREAPAGNIGKLSDEDISDWMQWDGDPAKLIEALVDCGWIDRDDCQRLVVHDWNEHADDATKKALIRAGEGGGQVVYFIRAVKSGLIKIGITEGNITTRLAALQVASPEKLEFIGSIEGNRKSEMALHKQFSSYRATGEWFHPSLELCRHISSVCGVECLPTSANGVQPVPVPVPVPVPSQASEDGAITPEMVTRSVLTELGLSGRDLAVVLDEVCRSQMKLYETPGALRDALIAAWREYDVAKPKLGYTKGATKFFGEGDWRNKEGWPWKPGESPPIRKPPGENKALQAIKEREEAVRRERGI